MALDGLKNISSLQKLKDNFSVIDTTKDGILSSEEISLWSSKNKDGGN